MTAPVGPMTAPVGYLVTVAILAMCTLLALAPPRRPWALGLLSYLAPTWRPTSSSCSPTRAQHHRCGADLQRNPREGQPASNGPWHEQSISQLESLMADGQRAGELRNLSTRVMAVTVRAAIDAAGYQLATDPLVDLHDLARELTSLFDHPTTSAQTPTSANPKETP